MKCKHCKLPIARKRRIDPWTSGDPVRGLMELCQFNHHNYKHEPMSQLTEYKVRSVRFDGLENDFVIRCRDHTVLYYLLAEWNRQYKGFKYVAMDRFGELPEYGADYEYPND